MIIRSNLAITLDGKIARAGGKYQALGSPNDRNEMQRLRALSDVVIIGASTLRQHKQACLKNVPGADKPKTVLSHSFCNAVISRQLENISVNWPFFKAPNLRRILFVTTNELTKAQEKLFAKTSEIVVLKKSSRTSAAEQMIKYLESAGFSRLLVEGGGELMWDFVSHNLIDEYHVTLTPKLLGGKLSPTLVEGTGFTFKQMLSLDLTQVRQVNSELFLTYRKRS